jgi:bifunctional non-homologous end joining protein LigD
VPKAVGTVDVAEKEGGTGIYLVIENVDGLVSLVQMGVLEIHPWGSAMGALECPDRLVFDLDPDPAVPLGRVVEAALLLRAELQALGLESFLKTTGGKGLHVVVPTEPKLDWEVVKPFTRGFAEAMVAELPSLFTLAMLKKNRADRIFLDYLRNGRGATAIAPYSTRARAGATVATPIDWSEAVLALDLCAFTLETVPARLARLKRDPWEELPAIRQSIAPSALRAVAA